MLHLDAVDSPGCLNCINPIYLVFQLNYLVKPNLIMI